MYIMIIALVCAAGDQNITTDKVTYSEAIEAIEEGAQYAAQEDCDQVTYTWVNGDNDKGTVLGYTRFNRYEDGSWQVCVPTDTGSESCGASQWGEDIDD